MTTIDLVATYTHQIDMISMITCLIMLLVTYGTMYFADDLRNRYLQRTIHFVLIATVSNLGFYVLCKYFPDWMVCIFLCRGIYHLMLLQSLFVFLIYVRRLLGLEGRLVQIGDWITKGIFTAGVVLDILSPITHFGFYYADGVWHDSTFMKPFTFVYIYSLILFGVMLIFCGRQMVKQVRVALLITGTVCAAILLMECMYDSNAYTTFTFVLPILVVIMLLHSQPYDVATGARNEKTFEYYLNHIYKRGYSMNYMVLRLDMRGRQGIPGEVGHKMYNFWQKYFKETLFFQASMDTFVLAVPGSPKNGNVREGAEQLFFQVFPQWYEKYRIDYQILGLYHLDSFHNALELKAACNYFFNRMQMNQVYEPDEQQLERIRLMRSVLEELADIQSCGDPEDPRVLVYCQPVKNVKEQCFDTGEALMRLRLRNGQMVFPDVFIPLAEQYGYIHMLSKIILNKVCVMIGRWLEDGYMFRRISVNFSTLELSEDCFCQEIAEIIQANRIPFEKIGFELTESRNDNDYQNMKNKIAILKQYGITLYLDDFGTGYSNFERILKCGMDIVKFDRSLLMCADDDQNVRYTLHHFSDAFRELGIGILFEGIETDSQELLCKKCGAEYLQGYKYSKPIPIEEMTRYFQRRNPDPT